MTKETSKWNLRSESPAPVMENTAPGAQLCLAARSMVVPDVKPPPGFAKPYAATWNTWPLHCRGNWHGVCALAQGGNDSVNPVNPIGQTPRLAVA
jgi:hypothetical protein